MSPRSDPRQRQPARGPHLRDERLWAEARGVRLPYRSRQESGHRASVPNKIGRALTPAHAGRKSPEYPSMGMGRDMRFLAGTAGTTSRWARCRGGAAGRGAGAAAGAQGRALAGGTIRRCYAGDGPDFCIVARCGEEAVSHLWVGAYAAYPRFAVLGHAFYSARTPAKRTRPNPPPSGTRRTLRRAACWCWEWTTPPRPRCISGRDSCGCAVRTPTGTR